MSIARLVFRRLRRPPNAQRVFLIISCGREGLITPCELQARCHVLRDDRRAAGDQDDGGAVENARVVTVLILPESFRFRLSGKRGSVRRHPGSKDRMEFLVGTGTA